MTQVALRAKIRALMASGALPKDPPVIQRSGRDSAWAAQQQTCAICAEPDSTVSYFWPGGIVVKLHASCDAVLLETALKKLEEGAP